MFLLFHNEKEPVTLRLNFRFLIWGGGVQQVFPADTVIMRPVCVLNLT